MSEYKGYNAASSLKFLFQERIKWFNAFRDKENDFELISDTYVETNLYEHVFFHRVNKRYETIVPKPDLLGQTQVSNSPQLVVGNPIALQALNNFASNLQDFFKKLRVQIYIVLQNTVLYYKKK